MPGAPDRKLLTALRAVKNTEMFVEDRSMTEWMISATVLLYRPDRGAFSRKSFIVWLLTSVLGRYGAKAASESCGSGEV